MTLWPGRYSRLLILNAKLFLQSFKLDAGVVLVGLIYVFGGESGLNLKGDKPIFLLVGFLFAALMESQIIKRNTANLIFYLRLPINQRVGLAFFYLLSTLPLLGAFTALSLLFRAICLSLNWPIDISALTHRYFQATFAFLFIKSLTINCMIAMSIHFALIAAYFLTLFMVLICLSILQELISPLFVMDNSLFALLFLLSTYLISFLAIKKIRL